MTIDNHAHTSDQPNHNAHTHEEVDAWVNVRQNPENPRFEVTTLEVEELPYYRLDPPGVEFQDDVFSVTVGVCGYHGHTPIRPRDLHPDRYAEHVLLGVNGTQGTRLVNVLFSPGEVRQLIKSLEKAADSLPD